MLLSQMETRLSNLEATINMSAPMSAPLSVDDIKLGFGAHVAAENVTACSVLYAWVAKIETRSNARSDKMEANFVEAKASMEKRSDAVVVDSKKLFDEANVRAETRSDEANVRAEGRSDAANVEMTKHFNEANVEMKKHFNEALNKPKPVSSIEIVQVIFSFLTLIRAWR